MNNGYARLDRAPEIVVVRSRAAVQDQGHACRRLDLRNPFDVQMLSRFTAHHRREKPVHIAVPFCSLPRASRQLRSLGSSFGRMSVIGICGSSGQHPGVVLP
jgi:hypothetical protein